MKVRRGQDGQYVCRKAPCMGDIVWWPEFNAGSSHVQRQSEALIALEKALMLVPRRDESGAQDHKAVLLQVLDQR